MLRSIAAKGKDLCARGGAADDDFAAWSAEMGQALADALGRNHPLIEQVVQAGHWWPSSAEAIQAQVKVVEGACIPYLERQPGQAAAEVRREAPVGLARLRQVLARFHRVALTLRHRHAGREPLLIENEYDVQDLLAALLALDFDDVRPEESTPSYAGKSARMDFLLKSEQTVVEAKFAKAGHAEKEIGTELIEDIARYKAHPACKRLVCFVYDPTHAIRNASVLERDLSGVRDRLPVEVVVAPKP